MKNPQIIPTLKTIDKLIKDIDKLPVEPEIKIYYIQTLATIMELISEIGGLHFTINNDKELRINNNMSKKTQERLLELIEKYQIPKEQKEPF